MQANVCGYLLILLVCTQADTLTGAKTSTYEPWLLNDALLSSMSVAATVKLHYIIVSIESDI